MGKKFRFGKWSKKFVKGQPFNAHESTAETAKRAKKVGQVLEVIGAITGQPEVVAVGAGVSAVGAASQGDVLGVISKGSKAAGAAGKATGDKDLQKRAKTGKKIGKAGKKIQKKRQEKAARQAEGDKYADLQSGLAALAEASAAEIATSKLVDDNILKSINQYKDLTKNIAGGLAAMDADEQAIATELDIVAEEEEEQLDLLEEGLSQFLSGGAFVEQIERANNLNDALDMLVRNENNLFNLPANDLSEVIRAINVRF